MKLGKRKVTAVILGGSLVLGAGTAFAQTDIGQQFKTWATSKVIEATGKVDEEYLQKGIEKSAEMIGETNTAKNLAGTTIDTTVTEKKSTVSGELSELAKAYEGQLTNALTEQKSSIEGTFLQIVADKKGDVDETTTILGEASKKVASKELGGKKESAISQLEKDIADQTGDISNQLQVQIDESKGDITKSINQNQTVAQKEVNEYLTTTFDNTTNVIKEYIEEITATNIEAIEIEANKVKDSANAIIDGVINEAFKVTTEEPDEEITTP